MIPNPTEEFEKQFVAPRSGRTLIVGSKVHPGREDRRGRFSNALGVDMSAGPGVDVVHNMEKKWTRKERFDHIECISVLEHTPGPWRMARVLETILVPQGTIFVTAPTIWRYHGYPRDYWRFTSDGIEALFKGIIWDVMRYGAWDGTLWHIPRLPRYKAHEFRRVEIMAFGHKK